MRKLFLGTVALAVLVTSSAFAGGWKDQYKTLRFGILSGENEKDRIARYTPFEKFLEKELGVDVEICNFRCNNRPVFRPGVFWISGVKTRHV